MPSISSTTAVGSRPLAVARALPPGADAAPPSTRAFFAAGSWPLAAGTSAETGGAGGREASRPICRMRTAASNRYS